MTFCQFIKGTPSRHDAECKCGAPTVNGTDWCAFHYTRVYVLTDAERVHELNKLTCYANNAALAVNARLLSPAAGFL